MNWGEDLAQPQRQLPKLTDDNRFFWEGGRDNHLLIQRCVCGRYQHPPLPRCPTCGSEDFHAAIMSGKGHVASYTVNLQSWLPGLVPYTLAVIELAEQIGLYIFSNVVECDVEDVRIGMPVEVIFEQQDDVWLPLFRPRKDAHD